MFTFIRSKLLLWMLVLLIPAACLGQVRGTISGYVRDATGAGIPNVAVTITNERTGAQRQATSGGQGFYQFLGLVPATYTVEAEVAGFKRYRNTGIELQTDQNLRVDPEMELGAITESVQVTAEAAVVDTRSSDISFVVDGVRMVDLPINGRNVIGFAALLPGVTQVSAPQNSDVTNTRAGPTITVNGGRRNQNYFTLNGTYFNQPSRNTGLNPPPPDAVQEFRIQTNNYTAEYGRNAGSIVTVVTRAGSNDFHGALWEFHRNSALNARSFFQDEVPFGLQNQFGAAAGLPILKDKLFAFGSYEGIRDRRAASTVSAFPPTAAERAGDFSSQSGPIVNPFTGQAFPNNQIPVSLFDPVARNLLSQIPEPPPNGRLFSVASAPRDGDLGMGRVDAVLTGNQTLFGHYYFNQVTNNAEGLQYGTNIPGWMGRDRRARFHNVGLNHTWVISPAVLNQITLGYNRNVSTDLPSMTRTNAELGIAGFPDYTDGGAVQLRVPGRFDLRSGGPVKFLSNNYDINENLSWIKGEHTMKFGFQFLDLSFFQSFLGPPTFLFNGTRSGNPLADFMLGAYRQVSFGFGVRVNDAASWYSGLYFQDDYKVTNRLTLNLGLRHEIFAPWVDKGDRINTIDVTPGAQSSVVPSAPPGLLFVGDLPRGLYETDLNNFGPRFGFAYDLFGNGKTAIRGAYGIFYESTNADTVAQENPPYVGSTRFFNGRLSNPAAGQTLPPVAPNAENFEFVFPVNGFFVDLGLRTPYIQQWNFAIEHQLFTDTSIQAAYVGKEGRKLQAYRPWNVAIFEPGVDSSGQPRSTLENANDRVPYYPGTYGTQSLILSDAFFQRYHSGQLRVNKRMSDHLSVLGSYTFGKSIDSSSTHTLGGCIANPYDLDSERGRADFDARHTAAISWLWTPVRATGGWAQRLLGGWTFSGIHQFRTGYPLTFFAGDDIALGSDICGGGAQHPNLVGDPRREHAAQEDMIQEFFNTDAFALPAVGQYGSAGRNILTGPAFSQTDFALLKDFSVIEGQRLQFRAEFFNLLNQVNFTNVRTTVTDSRFGQIDDAAPGRSIQFALKYIW